MSAVPIISRSLFGCFCTEPDHLTTDNSLKLATKTQSFLNVHLRFPSQILIQNGKRVFQFLLYVAYPLHLEIYPFA